MHNKYALSAHMPTFRTVALLTCTFEHARTFVSWPCSFVVLRLQMTRFVVEALAIRGHCNMPTPA